MSWLLAWVYYTSSITFLLRNIIYIFVQITMTIDTMFSMLLSGDNLSKNMLVLLSQFDFLHTRVKIKPINMCLRRPSLLPLKPIHCW